MKQISSDAEEMPENPISDKVYIKTTEDNDVEYVEYYYVSENSDGEQFAIDDEGSVFAIKNGELKLKESKTVKGGIGQSIVKPVVSEQYYSRIATNDGFVDGEFTVSKTVDGRLMATSISGDKYMHSGSDVWTLVNSNEQVTVANALSNGHTGKLDQIKIEKAVAKDGLKLLLTHDLVVNIKNPILKTPTKVKDGGNGPTYIMTGNGYWDMAAASNKTNTPRFSKDLGNRKTLTPFARNLRVKLFGNVLSQIEELFPYLKIEPMNSANIELVYGHRFMD